MGVVQAMRGILLCAAWYYSIIAGFFVLYCPVMYLLILNHQLYRKVADHLFALWELYPVALFQWCNKMHLHHYGDYVNADEKAIIIMNHRTRVDWNYIWIALYHAARSPHSGEERISLHTKLMEHKENINSKEKSNSFIRKLKHKLNQFLGGKSKIKFVLKDEIKNIPALGMLINGNSQRSKPFHDLCNIVTGWVMQMNYFLYVKRDWRDDQRSINQFVHYYNELNSDFRIVLFPEGTDLSVNNRHKSDRFALANNLPCYEYVLHPRTTGWAVLCSQLLDTGLQAVYDVTVAYDIPAQTETDLMAGRLPRHTYFYFKRYPAEDLPRNEEVLRKWLNERWREKESNLKNHHTYGTFLDSSDEPPVERPPRNLGAAIIAFIFWNLIDLIFLYFILSNSWFQFWVIYHSLLLIFITRKFGGFHNLQYKLL